MKKRIKKTELKRVIEQKRHSLFTFNIPDDEKQFAQIEIAELEQKILELKSGLSEKTEVEKKHLNHNISEIEKEVEEYKELLTLAWSKEKVLSAQIEINELEKILGSIKSM